MAPEQWQGGSLDVRTDLYALGCMMFEMVTGHWVFEGSTLTGFRRNHLEAEIPSLVDELEMPPMLDTLLLRCLAKDPGDRFATVHDFLSHIADLYFQEFCDLPRTLAEQNGFTAIDFNNRGSTYARLQYYDEALRDFDLALERDPKYTIAYCNRGSVYARVEQHADALENYSHAFALDPTDSSIYLCRGQTYARIGEYSSALADYTQAVKIEPTDATLYYARGKAYVELRKFSRALADFSIALMLNPEHVEAYLDMGRMLSRQGNWHEALPYCEKAAQLGSIEAIRQIAQIREHLNRQAVVVSPELAMA
jgi:tetratricopeptide (TPR) repeat protein